MNEIVVAKEAALAEFDRFSNIWDILHDLDEMVPEDRESFEKSRSRIVREIMIGAITIDEDGSVDYRLKYPISEEVKSVKISIPKASAHMAMDSHKEGQNMHKMFAYMGACSGKAPIIFSKMDARDIKLPLAVVTLFLGS